MCFKIRLGRISIVQELRTPELISVIGLLGAANTIWFYTAVTRMSEQGRLSDDHCRCVNAHVHVDTV